MRLDLAHALVAMREQAFVPFRIQRPGPGLESDLFGQRADLAFAACLVADIDGNVLPAGTLDGRLMPPSVSK